MPRLTPLPVALTCAALLVAGCGGGGDDAATTAPVTPTAPVDAPATASLGGVAYTFTGVDCVDRPDGVIAAAWGPDGLAAEVYLHDGTRSASLRVPDEASLVPRAWISRVADIAWTAPVAAATATAATPAGDLPARELSVRITCPARRGAGTGRVLVGTRVLVPEWVGCRRTGVQEVEVFARGTAGGRRWSLTLLRRATADGHGDQAIGLGALAGRATRVRTGDGDLAGRPGMFTVRGDRVALPAPGPRLAFAGGRRSPVTGTLTCGLHVHRT